MEYLQRCWRRGGSSICRIKGNSCLQAEIQNVLCIQMVTPLQKNLCFLCMRVVYLTCRVHISTSIEVLLVFEPHNHNNFNFVLAIPRLVIILHERLDFTCIQIFKWISHNKTFVLARKFCAWTCCVVWWRYLAAGLYYTCR